MKVKNTLLILLVSLFIFSCKSDDSMEPVDDPIENPTDNPGDNTEYVVETITPTGDENFLNKDSDYIFDQTVLHTFELNLPASALAQIDADPSAEQYVEGSLTFEGETISPVGIRYKGSIGAFVGCLSGTNWSNPSGYKTCTKLSMKVKINWDGSDTKFYGLKKLQFHSQNLDPTKMRERLGYYLFREMGVPAPRSVHARLMINGEYSGIYALTEQIDGRFTRYNYEDGKGNLYKEVWPLNHHGNPQSATTFINALKTNEDENPNADMIRSFATEIATASESERQAVVEKWMNMPSVISYAVVDRMIRNDDGAFHWYCSFGGCSPHNFYWYEETDAEKVHIIPWDLDNAFENIITNVNPVTPIADDWGETTNNCQPFSFGSFGLQQRSAACDIIVSTWASYQEEYETRKEEFKQGIFSKSNVDNLLQSWSNQIRDAVHEADETHNDEPSVSEWENEVSQMKVLLDFARNN